MVIFGTLTRNLSLKQSGCSMILVRIRFFIFVWWDTQYLLYLLTFIRLPEWLHILDLTETRLFAWHIFSTSILLWPLLIVVWYSGKPEYRTPIKSLINKIVSYNKPNKNCSHAIKMLTDQLYYNSLAQL